MCSGGQILASGSTAYEIPWPANFSSFLSTLRLFLVDVISITRTNCAQPMNYYASMMTVLIGVKVVLVLMLVGPWAWARMKRSRYALGAGCNSGVKLRVACAILCSGFDSAERHAATAVVTVWSGGAASLLEHSNARCRRRSVTLRTSCGARVVVMAGDLAGSHTGPLRPRIIILSVP